MRRALIGFVRASIVTLPFVAGCGSSPMDSGSPFVNWQDGPWSHCGSDCASATPTKLAAGDYHTCALMSDGSVRCWGDDSREQLADGSRLQAISGLSDIVDIAAGSYHSCALRKDGAVFCWGRNTGGQLGRLGDMSTITELVQVDASYLKNQAATRLAAAGEYSCAIVKDTSLACWGSNYDIPSVAMTGIAEIALMAGTAVSCIRYTSGEVRMYFPSFGLTMPYSGLSGATELAAGSQNVCLGVFPDGSVRGLAFFNPRSNLNGPNRWDSVLPILSPATPSCGTPGSVDNTCLMQPYATPAWAQGIKHVALNHAGAAFACLNGQDGTVSCWGQNDGGQQGNGTVTGMQGAEYFAPTLTPTRVAGLSEIESIVSGAAHTCVLDKTKRVYCFGNNYPNYPSSKLGNADQASGAPPMTPLAFTP